MEKAFVSGVQVIQIAGVFLKQGKNGLMKLVRATQKPSRTMGAF
jgi:hypothetical protein